LGFFHGSEKSDAWAGKRAASVAAAAISAARKKGRPGNPKPDSLMICRKYWRFMVNELLAGLIKPAATHEMASACLRA
jgi:hypothetical protein